jgi:hypothetical protein
MTSTELAQYNLKNPANGPALAAFIDEYLESTEHRDISAWITDNLKDIEYKGISVATNGSVRQKWKGGILGNKMIQKIINRHNKDKPVDVDKVMGSFMDLILAHFRSQMDGRSFKTYERYVTKTYEGNWQFSGHTNWFMFFVSLSVHEYQIGQKILACRDEINGSTRVMEKYNAHMKKKFIGEFRPILQSLMKHGLGHEEIQELVNEELIRFIQGT